MRRPSAVRGPKEVKRRVNLTCRQSASMAQEMFRGGYHKTSHGRIYLKNRNFIKERKVHSKELLIIIRVSLISPDFSPETLRTGSDSSDTGRMGW